MSSAVRIEPRRSSVPTTAGAAPVASIALGGHPRGAVVVLIDEHETGLQPVDLLNLLAEHGYESITCDPALAPAGSSRALVDALAARLAESGWEHEQVGLLGVGSAGQLILDAITDSSFGAAVTIGLPDYSADEPASASPFEAAVQSGVRTPWLGLWAGSERRAAALRDSGAVVSDRSRVYTEVVCYTGIPTDFYRDLHDSATHAAAFDAWQRSIEWLNLRVAPRLSSLALSWAASNGSATANKQEWD